MIKIKLILLCGGSGNRLWPLSRKSYPKQFLSIFGKYSLFQQTVLRVASLSTSKIKISSLTIITNDEYRFIIKDQIESLLLPISYNIILEPSPKNTAPALTLGALESKSINNSDLLLVLPTDHLIKNEKGFISTLNTLIHDYKKNDIGIIGIEPNFPNTEYGYIKVKNKSIGSIFTVEDFVEKPNLAKAQKMCKSKEFYWNAGMFLVNSDTWLEAIKKYSSSSYSLINKSYELLVKDLDFFRPDKTTFEKVKSISIDYAVMESFQKFDLDVKMVKLESDWSDIGSFDAFNKIFKQDSSGNTNPNSARLINSKNNIVISNNKKIFLIDIDDLIVVNTEDVLLVTKKNNSKKIKLIAEGLQSEKSNIAINHNRVHRPWG